MNAQPLAIDWSKVHALNGKKPVRLKQLSGGKNNKVFRITSVSSECFILKVYNPYSLYKFDRCNAEWTFLTHAKNIGLNNVPSPIERLTDVKACIYSFFDGQKINPEKITDHHVFQAADFIRDINSHVNHASFMPAAEHCSDFASHIHVVDKRLERLENIIINTDLDQEAAELITKFISPAWTSVRHSLVGKTNTIDKKTVSQLHLSPSDFGMHNILWDNDKAFFVDFEYSGLDNLAKLVNDFFTCPEIPVSEAKRHVFIKRISNSMGFGNNFSSFCEILRDLYTIKWLCIVLNEFVSGENDRKKSQFASNESSVKRKEKRLETAKKLLQRLR